jgi:hypothetical protein
VVLAQAEVQKMYGDEAYGAITSSPAELAAATRKAHESLGRLVKTSGAEKQ